VKTKIKVCGVTRLDQAILMESMGVNYLGFNFVKTSPRFVKPAQVAEIIQELGTDIVNVGVFMDQTSQEVKRYIKEAGLDALQFHGSESPEYLAQFDLPKFKVFPVDSDFDPEVTRPYDDVCDFFLFDTKIGNQVGGTGETFDWLILEKMTFGKPWFLAGGISHLNSASAVAELQPYGLDLNSKIEVKPGFKDLELLQDAYTAIEHTEDWLAEEEKHNAKN
jgi:phosphoribosylanthranilate isomerase